MDYAESNRFFAMVGMGFALAIAMVVVMGIAAFAAGAPV